MSKPAIPVEQIDAVRKVVQQQLQVEYVRALLGPSASERLREIIGQRPLVRRQLHYRGESSGVRIKIRTEEPTED